MTHIVVTPLSKLAQQMKAHRPSHVVTLTSGAVPDLGGDYEGQRLALTFNDIVEPRADLIMPDANHVRQLLDFARQWNRQAPLLIHCYAGVSRSTAAAFIVASALQPDKNEARLAQDLRRCSPQATPNMRLVALADALLGREGRMEQAITAIGRGVDAFEGAVFSLPVAGSSLLKLH